MKSALTYFTLVFNPINVYHLVVTFIFYHNARIHVQV